MKLQEKECNVEFNKSLHLFISNPVVDVENAIPLLHKGGTPLEFHILA